jgi:hypothetical protein
MQETQKTIDDRIERGKKILASPDKLITKIDAQDILLVKGYAYNSLAVMARRLFKKADASSEILKSTFVKSCPLVVKRFRPRKDPAASNSNVRVTETKVFVEAGNAGYIVNLSEDNKAILIKLAHAKSSTVPRIIEGIVSSRIKAIRSEIEERLIQELDA